MIRNEWLTLDRKNILEKYDSFNQTLLFEAINKDEVDWLINHGVDVNHRDILGRTALWGSGSVDYRRREPDIIRSLFESGANADLLDRQGYNLFSSDLFFSYPELFIKQKDKYSIRDVIINTIYGKLIHKIEKTINLLHHNGFKLYYPFYIELDMDITQLDEYSNKCVSVQQIERLRLYNINKRNDYIDFFNFLKKFSNYSKIIHHSLNGNIATVYDIDEYLYRLHNIPNAKPTLYIVK
ncbi:ankyrin repeat domain-containing protein [Salmonella enterica]|nr:ankyrin repeat domain-containing protein [Salmonella enterica]EJJ4345582.1 ankyrin repeat domain-containing protein [Salmonella enterica]